MTRVPNWPELLAEYVESRRTRPFEWGSNDCALFLADWIVTATGVDHAKRWRRYKTASGAAAIVKRNGGMRRLALNAGLAEKAVGMAQRGDGVLAVLEGRETFGVVAGNAMWCGPGEDSLLFRPISDDVIAAFEV
ncbi:MAG TPA: hypothetical protein VGD45_20705 [Steroidobacter sp.]|uniref:DUF6950 family protein n=1 Tax=Steroidobacter sp. TaxID=1978227 RepID=UPI002EDAE341